MANTPAMTLHRQTILVSSCTNLEQLTAAVQQVVAVMGDPAPAQLGDTIYNIVYVTNEGDLVTAGGEVIPSASLTEGCGIDITDGVVSTRVDGSTIVCVDGVLSATGEVTFEPIAGCGIALTGETISAKLWADHGLDCDADEGLHALVDATSHVAFDADGEISLDWEGINAFDDLDDMQQMLGHVEDYDGNNIEWMGAATIVRGTTTAGVLDTDPTYTLASLSVLSGALTTSTVTVQNSPPVRLNSGDTVTACRRWDDGKFYPIEVQPEKKTIWCLDPDGGHSLTVSGTTVTLQLKVKKYTGRFVGRVVEEDVDVDILHTGDECDPCA